MPIKATCPSCQQVYNLADNLAGKKVKCKSCNNHFSIPEPKENRSADEEPRKAGTARDDPDEEGGSLFDRARKRNKSRAGETDSDDEAARPERRRSRADVEEDDDDDRPVRRRSRAVDEDVDDAEVDRPRQKRDREDRDDADRSERPRKRKKARGGMPVWGWILIGVGCLLGLGGVLLVLSFVISGSAINAQNFAKLQNGMTEAEVKAILGSPTETLDNNFNRAGMGGFRMLGLTNAWGWKSGENEIAVLFNNGRLVQKFGKFGNTSQVGGNRMF